MTQPAEVSESESDAAPSAASRDSRDHVLRLIAVARRNTSDGTLGVLADWCSERGLEETAGRLRDRTRGYVVDTTLAALSGLFGSRADLDPLEGDYQGRYSYMGGFPNTIFQPETSGGVTTQPQVPIRPCRFVLARRSRELLVTDIKIGKNSQLVAATPVPGDMFHEFGGDLEYDVADISVMITMNLSNPTTRPITFNGGFFGIVPDGSGLDGRSGGRSGLHRLREEHENAIARLENQHLEAVASLRAELAKHDERQRDLEKLLSRLALKVAGA